MSEPQQQPLTILLVGYGTLALGLLEALVEAPVCRVVAALRWRTSGLVVAGRDPNERKLAALLRRCGIPQPRCGRLNSLAFRSVIEQYRPACVLLASWGEILSRRVLQTAGTRFVNCHPSMLPAHRGPNPYASAIRHGEPQTGVTFHLVDPGIDTGPVIMQRAVPIEQSDTGKSLRARCARCAASMVPELVERLRAPELQTTSQSALGEPSYFRAPRAADGLITWQQSASELHNLCRSLVPWVNVYALARTKLGRVLLEPGATVAEENGDGQRPPGTVVSTTDNTIWVATRGGGQLGLMAPRLCIAGVWLPRRLSMPVARRLLRPDVFRGQFT